MTTVNLMVTVAVPGEGAVQQLLIPVRLPVARPLDLNDISTHALLAELERRLHALHQPDE